MRLICAATSPASPNRALRAGGRQAWKACALRGSFRSGGSIPAGLRTGRASDRGGGAPSVSEGRAGCPQIVRAASQTRLQPGLAAASRGVGALARLHPSTAGPRAAEGRSSVMRPGASAHRCRCNAQFAALSAQRCQQARTRSTAHARRVREASSRPGGTGHWSPRATQVVTSPGRACRPAPQRQMLAPPGKHGCVRRLLSAFAA